MNSTPKTVYRALAGNTTPNKLEFRLFVKRVGDARGRGVSDKTAVFGALRDTYPKQFEYLMN